MDYVPSKQNDYNNWQLLVVGTVTAQAIPWAINPAALALLQGNSNTYTPLYDAIKNKNIRTPQQVYAHDTYKKTYTKFLRGFVQGSLVNNALITPDELVAIGLNPHLYVRTQRPKINDLPTIAPSSLGGGEVRFRCTTQGLDSKGRHPDSNGIELFYAIEPVTMNVNPVDPNPTPAEPYILPVEKEQQFLASIFSPKAIFVHAFGVNAVGKVLRVYGRWVNTSNTSHSGPFGGIASIVIS